jgi:hypothetical protein
MHSRRAAGRQSEWHERTLWVPMSQLPAFEKLGQFYLGRSYDLEARKRLSDYVLYDSKDLLTHAVCVGMTGSGKTGLCIGLIEEAAIDGIPSIIIDPKGDLSNLLLTFPSLQPSDFAPYVNEEDATKKGMSRDEFAATQAKLWRDGLAQWDQNGERIQRLKDAADVTIYTPGSNAGVPVSILRSFECPAETVRHDPELYRELVSNTATSILTLIGEVGDAQSREHTLLSNIFAHAWNDGKDLDLAGLITFIQKPPFTKLGVMEVEGVFPAKERFALAMKVNNLVASPGFAAWTQGQALDIHNMLFTSKGTARIAVFSIAHLNDSERMFFVSMLLNHVLGWVRTLSGTSSLRALLYMDEIAGYFPPVANPPSKQPLLTLMKQARAFGVGCLLATQNPVDIDYKGLSNAGTWFIGRLQTQRDKDRVLDGLEGASASMGGAFDRARADRALSALGQRVFLMNNVHEDGPVIFETRWCLSYLRGPLTRAQIKQLMAGKADISGSSGAPANISKSVGAVSTDQVTTGAPEVIGPASGAGVARSARKLTPAQAPVLPPGVPQYFIPSRETGEVVYQPRLLGLAKVHYNDTKMGVEHTSEVHYLAHFGQGVVSIDWDHAVATDYTEADLEREVEEGSFAPLPPEVNNTKSFDAWKKQLTDALFRRESVTVLYCDVLESVSKPGESEQQFRARLIHAAREARDAAVEKLRAKYAPRLATLEERARKAQQQVEVQKDQAAAAKTSTFLGVGTAILGAFFGRKIMSAGNVSKAASVAKGYSRQSKEAGDVSRAEETVEAIMRQHAQLEAQLAADIEEQAARVDPSTQEFEKIILRPKKTAVAVRAVVLVWEPVAA